MVLVMIVFNIFQKPVFLFLLVPDQWENSLRFTVTHSPSADVENTMCWIHSVIA